VALHLLKGGGTVWLRLHHQSPRVLPCVLNERSNLGPWFQTEMPFPSFNFRGGRWLLQHSTVAIMGTQKGQ